MIISIVVSNGFESLLATKQKSLLAIIKMQYNIASNDFRIVANND